MKTKLISKYIKHKIPKVNKYIIVVETMTVDIHTKNLKKKKKKECEYKLIETKSIIYSIVTPFKKMFSKTI